MTGIREAGWLQVWGIRFVLSAGLFRETMSREMGPVERELYRGNGYGTIPSPSWGVGGGEETKKVRNAWLARSADSRAPCLHSQDGLEGFRIAERAVRLERSGEEAGE